MLPDVGSYGGVRLLRAECRTEKPGWPGGVGRRTLLAAHHAAQGGSRAALRNRSVETDDMRAKALIHPCFSPNYPKLPSYASSLSYQHSDRCIQQSQSSHDD